MPQDSRFTFSCTKEEKASWEEASGYEPVSSWARRMLNGASGYDDSAPAPAKVKPKGPTLSQHRASALSKLSSKPRKRVVSSISVPD